MCDTLKAIASLRSRGLHRVGVIGAYHTRRVVPLMARVLSLFEMMPVVELGGMVLAQGLLHNSMIVQLIKEVMMSLTLCSQSQDIP